MSTICNYAPKVSVVFLLRIVFSTNSVARALISIFPIRHLKTRRIILCKDHLYNFLQSLPHIFENELSPPQHMKSMASYHRGLGLFFLIIPICSLLSIPFLPIANAVYESKQQIVIVTNITTMIIKYFRKCNRCLQCRLAFFFQNRVRTNHV